jgi:hypothetical protein
MANLHIIGKVLATAFSVVFAVLLFPSIVGVHGVAKSLVFTALGVGFIWLVYFMLGNLFKNIHDHGRKEGEEDNTDFV